MSKNPNANKNLRPFPKGVSGNPNGRPRSLAHIVKEMPLEAQTDIYGVLYHAISLRNENEARAYLEHMNNDPKMGQYGIVLQLAIKQLTGPRGWETLMDIMDRLFGKPRLQVEDKTQTNRTVIVVSDMALKAGEKWCTKRPGEIGPRDKVIDITLKDPKAREGLLLAMETGAMPRPPLNETDDILHVDNQEQADMLLHIGENIG